MKLAIEIIPYLIAGMFCIGGFIYWQYVLGLLFILPLIVVAGACTVYNYIRAEDTPQDKSNGC